MIVTNPSDTRRTGARHAQLFLPDTLIVAATTFTRIVALQSRRNFWMAQLRQAQSLSRPLLAIMPARFVTRYDRKLAGIMARQDLHVPDQEGND